VNDNSIYSTMVCCIIVGFSIVVGLLYIFRSHVKHLIALAGKATFSWLNNKALRSDGVIFGPRKEKLFSALHEMSSQLDRPLKLVEVGAGTGANFVFFPKNMEIVCVEPNEFSKKFLLANAAKLPGIEIKEYHIGFGEDMNFIESESVDAVVCTHALCSVRDVDQCLKEILRILKKGGKFLFVERVDPPSTPKLKFGQHIFKLLGHFFGHGCHPKRSVNINIEKAGFSKVPVDYFDADTKAFGPIVRMFFPDVIPHCMGAATK
jgi:ubiquinone/menaquinone biosynthesis C-methylase UbiE